MTTTIPPTLYREHRRVLAVICARYREPGGLRVRDVARELKASPDTVCAYARRLRSAGMLDAATLAPTYRPASKKVTPSLRRVLAIIEQTHEAGEPCTTGTIHEQLGGSYKALSVRVSELRKLGLLRPFAALWPTSAGTRYDHLHSTK